MFLSEEVVQPQLEEWRFPPIDRIDLFLVDIDAYGLMTLLDKASPYNR